MQCISFDLLNHDLPGPWEQRAVNVLSVKTVEVTEKFKAFIFDLFFDQLHFDNIFINKDHYSTSPKSWYSRKPVIYR